MEKYNQRKRRITSKIKENDSREKLWERNFY